MDKNIKRKTIPVKYKKFFWDVDFNQLNLDDHRTFILERLLNYGTFDTFKWIFKTFNVLEVRSLIHKKGKAVLTRNSLFFWSKIAKDNELWKSK